jgi:hypothetical protein
VVGKSGSGKSTLLFNLAMLDIMAGKGVAIIDPHGDLAETVADCVPRHRTHETCYLDVTDTEWPIGFNPLAGVAPARQALAASGIVWADSWGPRLEHWLFQGIASLLATRQSTLLDLSRLFTDDVFREHVVRQVKDPITLRFWQKEFASYDQRFRAEATSPILNKVGQFSASPNLRAILGQVAPKFDLAYAMNNSRILIANLVRGQIGEQAANLLGSLLVSHLQLVAMERSALSPEARLPFYVHVDEFQSFGTDAFASLLSEARKFATHFCLVNQFTDQLQPSVRSALQGNAGTLIVFRVGSADAELLAPEFYPVRQDEIADQARYWAWLRLCTSQRFWIPSKK